MNPAPSDPAEILLRVRQQLILAQVRIMELEDAQEESRSQLADNERLVDAAQSLADQKLDEAAHAEKTRADLQPAAASRAGDQRGSRRRPIRTYCVAPETRGAAA